MQFTFDIYFQPRLFNWILLARDTPQEHLPEINTRGLWSDEMSQSVCYNGLFFMTKLGCGTETAADDHSVWQHAVWHEGCSETRSCSSEVVHHKWFYTHTTFLPLLCVKSFFYYFFYVMMVQFDVFISCTFIWVIWNCTDQSTCCHGDLRRISQLKDYSGQLTEHNLWNQPWPVWQGRQ